MVPIHTVQTRAAANFFKTAGVLIACVLLSLFFRQIGVGDANILMTYLIGVLVVILLTKGYWWGSAASVAFVLIFNFLFTEPVHTLMVNDPNYLLTFLIFLIASFLVGRLTTKLQRQLASSKRTQRQMSSLYQVSAGYLNLKDLSGIIRHGLSGLYQIQDHHSILYLEQNFQDLLAPHYLPEHLSDPGIIEQETPARWCFQNASPCGHGTHIYANSPWYYLPMKINNSVLGVVGLYCDTEITEEERIYINMVVSQMALAIQRELLYQQQESSRVELEKEKLRNNLLRSISHDLRTPLTGIAGSASFLMDSYDNLDKQTALSLLSDIGADVTWLNNLVENLLNMTRIQDGKLLIKKENEVVDDVVSEAVRRVAKLQKEHSLQIHVPNDILLVPMDGRLIVQVLVNLLGNAFEHTRKNASVELNVYAEEGQAVFEVADNGGGIQPDILDTLFESFVSAQNDSDSHRGIGLGLSICQSIVQAHGGTIQAVNNDGGGATFRFFLPLYNQLHN